MSTPFVGDGASNVAVQVGSLCANIASVVGCIWVLSRLIRRRNIRTCQKVFPRLVASLAISDLGMHMGGMIYAILLLTGRFPGSPLGCTLYIFWFRIFRFVSVFQELQIALVFWAQARRKPPTFQREWNRIVGVWVAGAMCSGIDVNLDRWTFDTKSGMCIDSRVDYLTSFVLIIAFGISLASYFAVLAHSCKRAPGSVVRRVLRRLAIYPLNFLLTYFLVLVLYLGHNTSLWHNGWFMMATAIMEHSNGWLNALAYACQIRAPQQDYLEAAIRGADRPSFAVEVGDEEVVEFVQESYVTDSLSSASTSNCSISSGNVFKDAKRDLQWSVA